MESIPAININHGCSKFMLEVTDPTTLKSSNLSDSLCRPRSSFPSFPSFSLPCLCASTRSKGRLASLSSCIYIQTTYYHEVHLGCCGAGMRGIGPGFCAPRLAVGRACEVSTSWKGRRYKAGSCYLYVYRDGSAQGAKPQADAIVAQALGIMPGIFWMWWGWVFRLEDVLAHAC